MYFFFHPFHIVEERPWPFFIGFFLFFFLVSSVNFFWIKEIFPLLFNLFFVFFTPFLWSRAIIREGTKIGYHTLEIEIRIKWSIAWFIISEICFFFAFFWGFFTFSLRTVVETGNIWPPLFVETIRAFRIPFLNLKVMELRLG